MRGVSLASEKVGRPIRRRKHLWSVLSAYVVDAPLGIFLGRGYRPRRQLKHRCRLTLAQQRQQHGPPVRKFERIVMRGQLILVDLSKNGRPVVDRLRPPAEQAGRQARNLASEGQLRTGHYTHRQSGIIRGSEAACPCAKVTSHELIADLRGSRTYALEAKVAHLGNSLVGRPLTHETLARLRSSRITQNLTSPSQRVMVKSSIPIEPKLQKVPWPLSYVVSNQARFFLIYNVKTDEEPNHDR